MKVLTVSTSDINGGAARAAYRLHRSLLDQGVDSQMLVQFKSSDDPTVVRMSSDSSSYTFDRGRPLIDILPVRIYRNKTKTLFSPAWFPHGSVVDRINESDADIVHLHWICGGMIRIEDLVKIKKPLVWSLHDNWAFTGGCHIMWDCKKYQDKCDACPRLGSYRKNDLSRSIFNRKKKVFSHMEDLTIVGLSKWLNDCSQNSSLLKNKKHINLPNPLDTNEFKIIDKSAARQSLKLPLNKKLILFGAMDATSDVNKGFNELMEALRNVFLKDVELVIFGGNNHEQFNNLGFRVHCIGHVNDNLKLNGLYSASDVMIVPSRQEAFGQTASEAMSCGTPVVAFGHTGLLDIVDHKQNGYLAKPFDTHDLARGIEWVLENEEYDTLCKCAREKVVKNFDAKIVAQKYIQLYESII